MNRRFCGLVLCATACLTSNAFGGDFRTAQSGRSAVPGSSRVAMANQMLTPTADPMVNPVISGEVMDDGYFDPGIGDPHFRPVGTIGRTYTRISHAIPIDKHPRTAMLAVKDNGKIPYLSVGIMGGVKMKNGIWIFESTRPLDPGACQIVRVEARQTPQDVEAYAVRFVRLIPGRIVYLDV